MIKLTNAEHALRKTIYATTNLMRNIMRLERKVNLNEILAGGINHLKKFARQYFSYGVTMADVDWSVVYTAVLRWERADHRNEHPLFIVCGYMGVNHEDKVWQMEAAVAAKYLGAPTLKAMAHFHNISSRTIVNWFSAKPTVFYMLAESTPSGL